MLITIRMAILTVCCSFVSCYRTKSVPMKPNVNKFFKNLMEDSCKTPNGKQLSKLACFQRCIASGACYQALVLAEKSLKIPEFLVVSGSTPICHSGTGNAPGAFIFPLQSGWYRIRINHISGGISCATFGYQWPLGCRFSEEDHKVIIVNMVNGPVVIEKADFNHQIGQKENTASIWTDQYFKFLKDRLYTVWYEEDFIGTVLDFDNAGTTCVNVLAMSKARMET